MKNRIINIVGLLVIIFAFCNCTSNQSKSELTRQDALPASLTLLTELREAVGWYRDSLGKWSSSNDNSIKAPYSPDKENNFTHISLFDANYNGRNYIILDIGYMAVVPSGSTKYGYIEGIGAFSWDIPGSSTEEEDTYYIIDPRKLKISLKENRRVINSIEIITYSSNPNNDLQYSVTYNLRSEIKFKGKIHFYTLYNKNENIVRFYIKHRISMGIPRSTIFEDYYYEVDYQKFMEVFGNWIR